MELCEKTLENWLEFRNQHNYNVIIGEKENKIIHQVLLALSYVHQKSIMHRDINPKNIFLTNLRNESGDILVQLGDFGLARELSNEPSNLDNSSASSHLGPVGTRSYAAPEQLRGINYDNKVDMYSLGLVILELYYAMRTFSEKLHLFANVRKDNTQLPKELKKHFPEINNYIKELLSHNPDSRPSANSLLLNGCFSNSNFNMENLLEKIDNQQRLINDLKNQLCQAQKNCKCGYFSQLHQEK